MQYIDYEHVLVKLKNKKDMCSRNSWPIIDVTQKFVEEISATIIQYFNKMQP
ncbi:kinase/pyrophosphorylase [Ehrlichia chaffeensis]|uniref:kinase/pyrophosphorylase n=1 Tax=Ehrlichia chaffeensis TaxID=945 RepID=UPI003977B4C3